MAMASEIALRVINLAGDLVSQTVKWAITRTSPAEKKAEVKEPATAEKAIRVVVSQGSPTRIETVANHQREKQQGMITPTTDETIMALQEDLASELTRIERDLQRGARIFGKPCDCLMRQKHGGAITSMAGELMSYQTKPVYEEIIDWYNNHEHEFQPAAIMNHQPDYYRAMMPKIREFRKQIMSETAPWQNAKNMTLDEAKRIASEEAAKKVEDLWKSGKEVSPEG